MGVQKSKEPEPYCWVSILNFHDAVELFLELALEKLKAKEKERHLLEDWGTINEILKNQEKNELTFKIQIEKLIKVRVNLKHYGTAPSKSAIYQKSKNKRVGYLFYFQQMHYIYDNDSQK